ncbi:MAG: hypothetical protein ABIP64_02215 [Burkholderiales bacterium]
MTSANPLQTILKIILVAAVATLPIFALSEEISLAHFMRVLAINGGTAFVAFVLLRLTKNGYERPISIVLVWGLFALIAGLAATNSEPIAINIVNFVIVLVVANLLLNGFHITIVSLACVAAMVAIAYMQSKSMIAVKEQSDNLMEVLSEFVPQFIVVAVLLRLLSLRAEARRD